MTPLRIGYVPLTDAAVLIAAAQRGFAQAEGLDLELSKEVSWANIRDKLILGLLDAAHMLAPFAISTSLGLGHSRVKLAAPFALNLNGNAITLARDLFEEMEARTGRTPEGAAGTAKALAQVIGERRAKGRDPLTLGMVFAFSSHTYLLRHWLRLGGIDPEHDVRLVVIPPSYMVDSLRKGLVHGFCVGSPWNGIAVESQVGRIAVLGVEIAARSPEKVLALPADYAERNPELLDRLVRALRMAACWCEHPSNRAELARLLSAPEHIDLPEHIIRDTLEGDLRVSCEKLRRADKNFLPLGREDTNYPDPRQAQWLYAEMVHAGQTQFSEEAYRLAAEVYRPDLYLRATGERNPPFTDDPVGLTAGPVFSELNPRAYLASR